MRVFPSIPTAAGRKIIKLKVAIPVFALRLRILLAARRLCEEAVGLSRADDLEGDGQRIPYPLRDGVVLIPAIAQFSIVLFAVVIGVDPDVTADADPLRADHRVDEVG